MNRDEILPAALALPREDRAEIAQELIRSLDGPADADADEAWLAEIEQRSRELADGSVQPVDWEDVRERVLRRLRQARESQASS